MRRSPLAVVAIPLVALLGLSACTGDEIADTVTSAQCSTLTGIESALGATGDLSADVINGLAKAGGTLGDLIAKLPTDKLPDGIEQTIDDAVTSLEQAAADAESDPAAAQESVDTALAGILGALDDLEERLGC